MLIVTSLHQDDLEFLRSMRNLYRDYFFDNTWISPSQQQLWYNSLKPNQNYYIIRDDGIRVGAFSVVPLNRNLPVPWSPKPTLYLNSAMIAPEHRGKGLIGSVHQVLDDDHSYVGYIKTDNEPSLRAFTRIGMRDLGIFDVPNYCRMHVLLLD